MEHKLLQLDGLLATTNIGLQHVSLMCYPSFFLVQKIETNPEKSVSMTLMIMIMSCFDVHTSVLNYCQ